MKTTLLPLTTLLAALTTALPTKRSSTPTDDQILNYALTLEHLESAFYTAGLANFTAADFAAANTSNQTYSRIKTIAADEATHVTFLTSALRAANATPVAPCTYAFGVTSVESFLATAAVLEGVGVSAYLGAAADIASKSYLTAAASILTVEARHSAYIRGVNAQSPFPQPFDTPLSLDEVYTLAAGFIVECPPENPMLPVKAFPALTAMAATAGARIEANSTVVLSTEKDVGDEVVYAAFVAVTGPVVVDAKPVEGGFEVVVPEGFAGQSYVLLTSCRDEVTDDTVVAGPAILEIAS